MEREVVDIELLESTANAIKVRLPLTNIQIQMSHRYFQSKLNQGHFRLSGNSVSSSDMDYDYQYSSEE